MITELKLPTCGSNNQGRKNTSGSSSSRDCWSRLKQPVPTELSPDLPAVRQANIITEITILTLLLGYEFTTIIAYGYINTEWYFHYQRYYWWL